jgi:hypothetical protein
MFALGCGVIKGSTKNERLLIGSVKTDSHSNNKHGHMLGLGLGFFDIFRPKPGPSLGLGRA